MAPSDDAATVSATIDKDKDNLDGISQKIWSKPELNYEEVYAHSVLTEALEKYGFSVRKNYLLDTAFRAEFSPPTAHEEGTVVAILCEYDALPEIGHACGHNLIAEAGIAAAIGVKAVFESDSSLNGKVVVIGCPAEEGGGGKNRLIEGNAFKGIDVAMMVHPTCLNIAAAPFLCLITARVVYRGKEAHAAGNPWAGRNAVDAAVSAYVNLSLLRQQIKPECRIHIIIKNGGTAFNVIPNFSELEVGLRAPNLTDLNSIKARVKACVESASVATGCEVELEFGDSTSCLNIINNKVMVSAYRKHAESLGVEFMDENQAAINALQVSAGSSDMGNVSYILPSIHPMYYIGKFINHTKAFTEQSRTNLAHDLTRTSAKALALTAVELLRSPDLVKAAKEAFKKDLALNQRE